MKIINTSPAPWAYSTPTIQFSKREVAILRKASEIAAEARRIGRSQMGPDFEDHAMDTSLAEVEHSCLEILEGVELSFDRDEVHAGLD
jgi:hypothetical protein